MGNLKFPYSKLIVPVKELKHIFMQTEELTEMGVAVHPFGAIINPKDLTEEELKSKVTLVDIDSGLYYNIPLEDLSAGGNVELSAIGIIDETLTDRCVAGSEGDILPDGYRKVKSLTFNNNAHYEITDFYLKGSDTIKFACSITGACNVIGTYAGSNMANYDLYASTSNVNFLRYYMSTYNSKLLPNKRYDIELTPTGSHGMEIDSVWEEVEFVCEGRVFYIGNTMPSGTSAKMKGTFYGDVIVEDDEGLRFKGVPCVRESDNTVGYYDLVSKTFYEPTGENPTVEEYNDIVMEENNE